MMIINIILLLNLLYNFFHLLYADIIAADDLLWPRQETTYILCLIHQKDTGNICCGISDPFPVLDTKIEKLQLPANVQISAHQKGIFHLEQ